MIVQSYTFSKDQFNHIANGEKEHSNVPNFANKANTNCLDCPFNPNLASVYTHKFNQYVGFISNVEKHYQRVLKVTTICLISVLRFTMTF